MSEKIVTLYVGGLKPENTFTCSVDTLTSGRGHNSYFTARLNSNLNGFVADSYKLDDGTRNIFIDREPIHFAQILKFLRGYSIAIPENEETLKELKEEANFYNLQSLINYFEEYENSKIPEELRNGNTETFIKEQQALIAEIHSYFQTKNNISMSDELSSLKVSEPTESLQDIYEHLIHIRQIQQRIPTFEKNFKKFFVAKSGFEMFFSMLIMLLSKYLLPGFSSSLVDEIDANKTMWNKFFWNMDKVQMEQGSENFDRSIPKLLLPDFFQYSVILIIKIIATYSQQKNGTQTQPDFSNDEAWRVLDQRANQQQ